MTITRMSEGKTNRLFVGNMSDDKALELASKIVSEGFVFSVISCLSQRCHLVISKYMRTHTPFHVGKLTASNAVLAASQLDVMPAEQLVLDRLAAFLMHV